jgi:hypothetical protein
MAQASQLERAKMSSRQFSERPVSPSGFIYTPKGMDRNSCTDHGVSSTSYATASTEQYNQVGPEPPASQPVFRSTDWQGTTSLGCHVGRIPSLGAIKAEPEDISPPLGPGQPGYATPLVLYHIRHSELGSPRTQLHSVPSLSQRPLAPFREPQTNLLLAHPSPRRHSRPTFLPPPESPDLYTPPPPFNLPAAAATIKQIQDICLAATQRYILAQAQAQAQAQTANHPPHPGGNREAAPPRNPVQRTQRTRHAARRHAPYPTPSAAIISPQNHPPPLPRFNPTPHQYHGLPIPFHEPSPPPPYGTTTTTTCTTAITTPTTYPNQNLASSDGDTTPPRWWVLPPPRP